jgi:hypothetical protein
MPEPLLAHIDRLARFHVRVALVPLTILRGGFPTAS